MDTQPTGPTGVPVTPVEAVAAPVAPPTAVPLTVVAAAAPARKPSTAWCVIKTLLVIVLVAGLCLSVLLNLVLLGLTMAGGGVGMDRIVERPVPDLGAPGGRDKIALIRIDGLLEPFGTEVWSLMIDKARRDERVKAVVLVVNSGGGAITSADLLYQRLLKLRDSGKPIVVSMDGVAASGAYYISMPATEIIAQPTTITGSIGVMMPHYNLSKLLERYGVADETFVATGSDRKYSVSWTRETTAEGRRMIQTILDDAYERFVSVVEEGRPKLSSTQVRTLADGSVYTAHQAKESGLVDAIGYLEDAVERARALAGLSAFRVVRYDYLAPFSVRNLLGLGGESKGIKIDPTQLLTPQGPQAFYLWPGWSIPQLEAPARSPE